MSGRRVWLALLLIGWFGRLATTQVKPPEFPLEVTDRPIVLPAGAILAAPRTGMEIQVDPHVCLIGAAVVGIPIQQSAELHDAAALGVSAELLFAIHRWDFYVGGELGNITRTGPSTFVSGGFVKRWGI